MTATPRKRFYKTATVTDDNGIALDGRPVRTPMKQPLRLPTRALAEAIAKEWEAQGDTIDPSLNDPHQACQYRDRPRGG